MRRATLGVVALVALVAPSTLTSVALGSRVDRGGDGPVRLEAAQRTMALGISIHPGRRLAVLDSFTASIGGHRPATWSIWSQ
jgi:hypothetical protein